MDKALKFCETLADKTCPSWRREDDAEVTDSIPQRWDSQAHMAVKLLPTAENFHRWELRRQRGLVRHIRIVWGDHATRDFNRVYGDTRFWNISSLTTPIFIQIALDQSKCAVPGSFERMKTTAHRIYLELGDEAHKLIGADTHPKLLDRPDVGLRINISDWKKEK